MASVVGSLAEMMDCIRRDDRRFYVYVLRRPNGEPFYVGKGSGDRLAEHDREARNRPSADGFRLRIIRSIIGGGGHVTYEIAGWFNDESQAFMEEARLIRSLGRRDRGQGPLVNHTNGGEGAADPSEATIAKRSEKLRAVMADPGYRAAAVRNLRLNEETRKARAAAAVGSKQCRTAKASAMREKWKDQEHRERAMAGMRRAMDAEWKASAARRMIDRRAAPECEAKRRAAAQKPEAIEKMRASLADPAVIAKKSLVAKAQRARQEEVRRRVMGMSSALQSTIELPDWRAGVREWTELEIRLFCDAVI